MKRLMAMLTTIALIAGIVCQTAVFAAFSDVDDTNSYKKAITTLNKLSVIDGYEENGTMLFKPENSVTRAEFTKLIVFILGYQNMTYGSCDFEDVAADHWAKDYIQTAYNLGIISGFDDGTFRAEDPVTYEQALKMVVCTLGYEQFANQLGEWPEGYIKQANALSLGKNVSNTSYSDGAPRGVIAQVLYNALEVEMYENNGYTWNLTNKTLLNNYLKVKELKGTLVGVEELVTEDCTRELLEGQMDIMTSSGEEVIISYTTMTENISDISKYLGNTITVYYRQLTENDEKTLVIIDDETSKNSEYNITYEDIVGFSGNTLKYYDENSKTKSFRIKDGDFTVRYNGKIVSANETVALKNPVTNETEMVSRQQALELWLTPDTDYFIYGNVKLTDNANDGTIDMIQIYNYETIVAYSAPNTSDYRITDKLVTGNYIVLDPQSAQYTYTITKNGAEIPITSIATNDIVLYAKSLDETLYTLLVSNQTVKGTISSINSNGTTMNINGKTYNIGPKCASYIKDKDGKDIKTGASGTFYIDAFGTAVFGTIDQTAVAPYAYIANSFVSYGDGQQGNITVYSVNGTGAATSYPLKDKVKFNGSTISSDLVMDRLDETAAYSNDDVNFADKIYGSGKEPTISSASQPARVTIKDGYVTEIITLTSDEVQAQNDDKEQLVRCKELGQYTYSSNSFSQGGKTAFSVNSTTIVLCVPANRNDKSKYAKKTPSSAFTSGESYYVEAFDISSSKIAGLVILYGDDGSLTSVKKDTDFSIVSAYPDQDYNEDYDRAVLKLSLFAGTSGTVKEWTTFDDSEFLDVQPGDVIQFAYDSDQYIQGRINNIRFADIAKVLDGAEYDGQRYNWSEEQTPSESNNYQSYKFDYRFKKSGTDEDEVYTSSTLGTVPYSRACMYNVSQVLVEDKKLYVTKNGFITNDGLPYLDDSDYEEITVNGTTKIVRMEDNREEISPYAPDTTTPMSINDIRDARNFGMDCSKILVCSSKGIAKLIVVYN